MSSSEEFKILREDNSDIKSSISKLADSMTELVKQIARSEEKHENTEKTMQRFGDKLDKHDESIRRLDLKISSNSHIISIGTKIVWLIVGSAISGAIATLFYFIR